ncbi:Rieske (2Fe-2S) protein [Aeromicrobium sp.]|uniref:Rieske (2Fe-2S) protein n=1 Tax=Aeromicrobium sp. TaxID=1871063 RepID=UPI003D6ADA17
MTELSDQTTRRAVLGGVAAVGAGAVLAACGSDEPKDAAGGDATSGDSGSGGDAAAGGEIGTTADVPVNGGTVFQKQKIVVTQPTEGDFKAFTAVCTHSGCTVGEVNGDTIQCNCHGSQYSAEDGSVKKGPAPKPLAAKKLEVDGDKLIVS